MKTDEHASYRPEIDGLRALAILPVVLFHFDIPGFNGGFVGVDIFFVISGYLISRILWVELENTGKIRLGNFFMRRIRRLGPAYFCMAMASLIGAWFLLMPFDMREFGQELMASTLYLSNVHFFNQSGYFDGLAESKVLLHTWSLSVEEQFYIFLPLFMLLIGRFRKLLLASFPILLVLSLGFCIWMTTQSQPAAFYLFPFRAWEMLAGVCLGIFGHVLSFRWSLHPVISWASVVLIIGSIAFITSGEHFPGYWAIFPVLGASLMLANGRNDNWVNKVLSLSFLRFFGLISYSLYLWHWPIATLSKYYYGGELSWPLSMTLILLSILVSWVSWKFIETPVRKGAISNKKLFITMISASIAALSIGAYIHKQDGVPNRFGAEFQSHIKASSDFEQGFRFCSQMPTEGPFAGIRICPIGPEGPTQVLIWGDSHLRALKRGLEKSAHEFDVPSLIIWDAGCPPLLGITKRETVSSAATDRRCAAHNRQIAQALKSLPDLKSLFLVGRWSYYTEGQGIGNDRDNKIDILPNDGRNFQDMTQSDLLKESWVSSLQTYHEAIEHIFVLQQVPEFPLYQASDVARQLVHGHLKTGPELDAVTTVSRSDLRTRQANSSDILNEIERRNLAKIIESWSKFCDNNVCRAFDDETGYYFDNNHLTNQGALAVRDIFDPVFQSAKGEK